MIFQKFYLSNFESIENLQPRSQGRYLENRL